MPTFKDITQFTQQEIHALFKRARSIYSDSFFYIKQAKTQRTFGKLLLIMPKKIGHAPARNKLRRRIKAIFFEEKLYTFPFDTIIICKVGSTTQTFQEIKQILLSIFRIS